MNNMEIYPQKHEILNFEPYNEIANGQCFYRALFSVLNHYNVDIMNLLCNNIYFYGPIHSLEDGGFDYFGLNEIPGTSYEDLLAKSGVKMSAYCNVEDIVNKIINSVSNNKPVIIFIDCYFEPIRPDMYMKTHMPHSITIFGYDMDTEDFLIIEHDYVNGWNYKKRPLNFYDVERCYRGYVEDKRQECLSYFEFDNDIEYDKTWNSKRVLLENYMLHKEAISQGIKGLEEFIFNDFIGKRKKIEDEGKELTFVFNSSHKICRNQKVRNFTISSAFQEDAIINDKINKITNDWSMIMKLIYKYKASPSETRVFPFDSCTAYLKNVLDNEKAIHKCILEYCNRL